MQNRWQKQTNNRYDTNKGFSLIEVLVCIALIAIVCVPLFSGFRLSARLNNKAHYTQKVTAYAQKELETIKSTAVEDYKNQLLATGGAEITEGETYQALQTEATEIKSHFTPAMTLTPAEEEKLFTPILLQKDDIAISGKTYRMLVTIRPAPYSRYDQKITAAGVNVAGYFDTAEADSVRFPVISDEINLYDATCVELLKDKLTGIGISGKTDADILANMKKHVHVDVVSSLADERTEVTCEVIYSYPAESPSVELNFQVYRGSYKLDPLLEVDGLQIGEKSGGNAFILASAFQGSSTNCINEMEITSSGDAPVNIYFILGKGSGGKIYNFNSVTINGEEYSNHYHISATQVPGEKEIAGTGGAFKTNIKMNGSELSDETKTDSVGVETYKAITYAVEVELFEKESDTEYTRVAQVESLKINGR